MFKKRFFFSLLLFSVLLLGARCQKNPISQEVIDKNLTVENVETALKKTGDHYGWQHYYNYDREVKVNEELGMPEYIMYNYKISQFEEGIGLSVGVWARRFSNRNAWSIVGDLEKSNSDQSDTNGEYLGEFDTVFGKAKCYRNGETIKLGLLHDKEPWMVQANNQTDCETSKEYLETFWNYLEGHI